MSGRLHITRLAAVLAAVIALTAAMPAAAQTAGDLFDTAVVNDLQLFMNSRDLQSMRQTYLEDTYYQADLDWRGQRLRSIAVRSRGGGSRNPVKLGLKLDFNRYVSGQEFLGLRGLVLDNLWQDPSLVRESVTMALFARMGQPAPREAYARLFINGVYQGVYALIEPIDSVFLERTFGNNRGYLFDYEWLDAYRGEDLGPELDPYIARFSAENHDSQGDVIRYGPIHDLFQAVGATQTASWRDTVERYADVRQFLTHVAVETFVSELDGLTGLWAMNNFYLYRPEGTTRHQFLVWDRDNAFQDIDSSVLSRVPQSLLFQKLLAYDDLWNFYLTALDTCATLAADDGWLEGVVDARAMLIRDAAYQDTNKPVSNDKFDSEVAFLRAFARQRPAVVRADVEALRRSR
jgi:spore coat protein CotH